MILKGKYIEASHNLALKFKLYVGSMYFQHLHSLFQYCTFILHTALCGMICYCSFFNYLD